MNEMQYFFHFLFEGSGRGDIIIMHKTKDKGFAFSGSKIAADAMLVAKCSSLGVDV